MFTLIRQILLLPFLVFLLTPGLTSSEETFGISSFPVIDLGTTQLEHVRKAQPNPVWRADLRLPELEKGISRGPTSFGINIGGMTEPLVFADDNHLAVSLYTRQKDAAPLLRLLDVLFLEAATGRVVSKFEWSDQFDRIAFLALRDGRYVVRTAHRLTLYSPGGEVLAQFDMPRTHRPGEERWGIFVTPSRDSILVDHQVECTGEIKWLDSQTFKLKHTWEDTEGMFTFPANSALDASETSLVATLRFPLRKCGTPPLDNREYIKELPKMMSQKKWCELAVRDLDGPWRTIFRHEGDCPSDARFVSSEAIVFTSAQELFLLDTNGQVMLKDILASHEFTSTTDIHHSLDGHRIAVPILTMRGGSEILDISAHEVLKRIMVYDLPKHRWIYTLDAKNQKIKRSLGLALSADGSKLALLIDRLVELYHVPD